MSSCKHLLSLVYSICGGGKNSHQLIFLAGDVGDFHIVSRRRQIFEFLAREDVKSDEMDLCVAMLSRLGGRHIDDLARTALDDDMTILPQCRTLHRKSRRGTGVGAFESVLMLLKTSLLAESSHAQ